MEFIDLKAQYKQIQPAIQARINAVLEHGKYIMGPEVQELEEKLADYVGVKHCIAVSSGTDALLIAMMALEIQPGDEIITTPFTFISTGEMIRLLGAVPVFVDIDPDTYNISPGLIEAAITEKTRAIAPVSLYGQCADFDEINAIARKHGIPVIEDAAQSFGATYKGKKSCGLSTIGCTSFFPSKPLGCYGDGGACFTDDDALAKRMREIRVHGQERRYYHPVIGINGRMDTIQAAILIVKLEIFPEEVRLREAIGASYTQQIKDSAIAVTTPTIKEHNTSVYAQYTIAVDDREDLQAKLADNNIPTAVHYPVPLHMQPAFHELGFKQGSLPVSENAASKVMSLPMHATLKNDDIAQIVHQLNDALR
ncbi:MAG: DegT/DnrJ/EryC1/StrS family aminotransferase [Gammaproteobacteria bacterium]